MNRGSVARLGPRAGRVRASMRPRFMNRGSRQSPSDRECACQGFNEAPIHESGKCPASMATRQAGSGFNEAPIHESGKYGYDAALTDGTVGLQ